jgi:hypothetical protein
MHEHALAAPPDTNVAFAALAETWDGSQEHAVALAKLIRASRGLWPDLKVNE